MIPPESEAYARDVFGVYRKALAGIDLTGAHVLDVGAGGRYEDRSGVSRCRCGRGRVHRPVPRRPSDNPRIRVLAVDITDVARDLGSGTFDVAVSWVVLQEMQDLAAALEAIDLLLRPGGRMVHTIDLLTYSGLVNRVSRGHPLAQLAVPEAVYRLGTHRRRPNRLRLGAHRDEFRRLGYDIEVRVNGVLDRDVRGSDRDPPWTDADLHRVHRRPVLAPTFRRLPDEDLLVTNATLVATKPGDARPR